MAAVRIGHARYDERGKITGGKAGDQTGKEVCISNWYLHNKKWYVLRALIPEVAELLAYAMERACANNHIGYDQNQRNTLYNMAKAVGWDPGKVIKDCETDCSALVRLCLAYAGIHVADFNTSTEVNAIIKTGKFEKLTASEYCEKEDYLKRGDILVTRSKGHTAIVLTDGAKANASPSVPAALGSRLLRYGAKGDDVKELQRLLKGYGFFGGSIGGNYLTITETSVKAFQRKVGLLVDGEYGENTHDALMAYNAVPAQQHVIVTGNGQYYIRERAVTGNPLTTAKKGEKLVYLGVTDAKGWHFVQRGTVQGYMSGNISKLAS